MPPLAVDDTDLIRSIVGIARPPARRAGRKSPGSRPDALKQVHYILHQITVVAPDLYKRIEPVLMEVLSPEDWGSIRTALNSGVSPLRPAPRRKWHRVK
jgi:hypothetical protein